LGYIVEGGLFMVFLTPFFVGHAIATPFKKISPPLNPLRGDWEHTELAIRPTKSTLTFQGTSVNYEGPALKRGKWSSEGKSLSLAFDEVTAVSSPFRIACGDLILESPFTIFRNSNRRRRRVSPVVGDWRSDNSELLIKADGTFVQEKMEKREGTFQKNSGALTIHWKSGDEWTATIQHRHILVKLGGVSKEFHYAPPGNEMDM
jgi:hypothetical protein